MSNDNLESEGWYPVTHQNIELSRWVCAVFLGWQLGKHPTKFMEDHMGPGVDARLGTYWQFLIDVYFATVNDPTKTREVGRIIYGEIGPPAKEAEKPC